MKQQGTQFAGVAPRQVVEKSSPAPTGLKTYQQPMVHEGGAHQDNSMQNPAGEQR